MKPYDFADQVALTYTVPMENDVPSIVGHEAERETLLEVLSDLADGQGGLLLISGEAGMGVTTLAESCLAQSGLRVFRGRARKRATPAYEPLLQVLRQYLRMTPAQEQAFSTCGSLRQYLALLLPELGPVPSQGNRETLFEALGCALLSMAGEEPMAVFLDDLQWADNATLEFLAFLAGFAQDQAVLILGAFRSDDIPRGHPVRRLRDELRRSRLLQEINIGPLSEQKTADLLTQILGTLPAASLTALFYHRTQGVPLFIEELALALANSGHLQHGAGGLTLAPQEVLPLPGSIRDALLLRLDGLSDVARQTLEAAAVAGQRQNMDLLVDLAGDDTGLNELIKYQIIVETEPGEAAFRHALMQEAVYGEIPWTRRRELHRAVAAHLAATDAPSSAVAEHWLAGKAEDQARQALVSAAYTSCQLHAYRDAASAGQRALSIWPEDSDEVGRLALLDRLGYCAQLSGMFSEAVQAWREAARIVEATGSAGEMARIQRRLAGVLELQGTWDRALAAHQRAAEAFAAAGEPAEAAVERLAMVGHLQSSGNYTLALDILGAARAEIAQTERADLRARALGFQGVCQAKLGDVVTGREEVLAGLSLALAENLPHVAAEVYVRLATVSEHAADFAGAVETYETAYSYCEQNEISGMATVCLGCLAWVLSQTGQWEKALALCKEVEESLKASEGIKAVSNAVAAQILLQQGSFEEAERLITSALFTARKLEVASMIFQGNGSLLLIAQYQGDSETAARHGRELLRHWERTEERHYVVSPLCWAATFFAEQGDLAEVNACAQALSQIASATGAQDALAALSYVLGESAQCSGNMPQAASHFAHAEELFAPLGLPLEHTQAQLRAGMAAAADGKRTEAVDYLFAAYRTARRLGAKPLAEKTARELLALGEKVDERLGRRQAGQLKRAGLTRRQFEVLQLVAEGLTNQEIADRLVLSPRTVDMHVGHILERLDCRSRIEAVRKAGDLGLLS